MNFNAAQQDAIDARNQNMLISAAAGSGKTTVMVQKILETLRQNPRARIAQFVVITFTKDAAHNMKDKLRNMLEQAALDGDDQAARALSEIETATICTIHSFCSQLLKEYNDNTGASMSPNVLKNAEKKRMLDESFSDAAAALLDQPSAVSPADRQALGALLTAFTPEDVNAMTLSLYDALMGIPHPFDFLARVVADLPVALWNREILTAIELDLMGLDEILRREEELLSSPLALEAYTEVCENDAHTVSALLDAFPSVDGVAEKRSLLVSAKEALSGAPRVKAGDEDVKAWKKEMDALRNDLKGSNGLLNTGIKRLDALLDERNDRLNAIIRQELRGLELLTRETADQYARRKLEAGVIDYADMEQIAYDVISDPDSRAELLARYKYIYVDECQDVSGIQDAIIKSLTGPGHQLFMVGDIKQSIYGFRHAEPALFEHERQSYSDAADADERRIFFMDNYRSCHTVVDAVNAVFTEAMDARVTDLNYLPEDNLHCNLSGEFGPVDVLLVEKGEEEQQPETENRDPAADGDADSALVEQADRLEAQCQAAGRYIQSLALPDPETGAPAPYHYREIVILVSTAKGLASSVVEYLKKMHIPALYEGAPDFFSLSEVKAFLALLTVIDNDHNDDALVGTLLQSPFLFSERELADIRLENTDHVPFYTVFAACAERNEKPLDRRCRAVLDQLDAWRKTSEEMSVPDFVWWLMRETGIYAARGAWPDGQARQANLDALWQRALDGHHTRLSDFVGDLRQARETRVSDSDDHPALGPADDFVRVMTMHKSKGLEFPVVILMNLQRNLRRHRSDEKLRADISSSGDALGLYLPAVRRGRHSSQDSQGRDAFDTRALRRGISESTRLLYVAMTRAQQRLCLIGSVKPGDEALWRNQTRPARIWRTRSMLDMIMPAVLKRVPLPPPDSSREDALWRLTRVTGQTIQEPETTPESEDARIERALSTPAPMRLYRPEKALPAPLKTSVTTLSHQLPALSEDDSEETVEDKRKSEEAVRTFRLGDVPSRPAFLEEEKAEAVNIGTATHRFIRLLSLDSLREAGADIAHVVRDEWERMLADGILTEEESRRIRLDGVIAFFRGPLGQRMLASPDIRREAAFTMRLGSGATMVQGIVDCAFREGNGWILIDYKTDHDTAPETFVPRHAAQMNWYRAALERLTALPVQEMWLYALRAGAAYPVSRLPVPGEQDHGSERK